MNSELPVLPDVGSITTLLPGIRVPSFSAASTMALAILSLIEPPADMYSTFATIKAVRRERSIRGSERNTEVAFEAMSPGDVVETNEGSVAHGGEGIVEDGRRHGGIA